MYLTPPATQNIKKKIWWGPRIFQKRHLKSPFFGVTSLGSETPRLGSETQNRLVFLGLKRRWSISWNLFFMPVFHCLLLVLKAVSSWNFIGNNQSIPHGSNSFLRVKQNVKNDTNRSIFETLSKKIQCPLKYLFERNLMNHYYSYFADFLLTCVLKAEITCSIFPWFHW